MSATDGLRVEIEEDRLFRELEKLAEFSDTPSPSVTRIVYTETDRRARRYLRELFLEAGLLVREDPLGNMFVRWEGEDQTLPPVGTGSHIDALPHAGRFDGTVGVLGGLEAIRALQRAGFTPRRSIELVVFTSEEPTRFGLGCLGSRAMTGALTPGQIRALRDADEISCDEARLAAGYAGRLEEVELRPGHYDWWVELHIEQGPILEREGVAIGLVEAIAAPACLSVTFDGTGGHAGAVLMPERHDALCAAAEGVLAVERAARKSPSPDAVATVGILELHPGAVNSIPSRTRLGIDVRDVAQETRDRMIGEIRQAIEEIGARRGVKPTVELLNADPPCQCDPRILAVAEAACKRLGLSVRHMISRAYHDSLFMARLAPVAMIFIPCREGISHRPEEYASPQDIARGTAVLAHTLADLAV